jgi:hypothetical protein
MLMPSSRRALVLVGTILMLTLVTGGCARRGQVAADGSMPTPVAAAPTDGSVPAATSEASPAVTVATPEASAEATSGATGMPTGTAVPTPDLSTIEALIHDIDTDLGADASAAADEGSTP